MLVAWVDTVSLHCPKSLQKRWNVQCLVWNMLLLRTTCELLCGCDVCNKQCAHACTSPALVFDVALKHCMGAVNRSAVKKKAGKATCYSSVSKCCRFGIRPSYSACVGSTWSFSVFGLFKYKLQKSYLIDCVIYSIQILSVRNTKKTFCGITKKFHCIFSKYMGCRIIVWCLQHSQQTFGQMHAYSFLYNYRMLIVVVLQVDYLSILASDRTSAA